MKALIQWVTEANVKVEGKIVGEVGQGILALIGVEPDDTQEKADRLLHKLIKYRVFNDANDKMNLSLLDIKGGLLLVSQFTLVADTKSGLRPSFSTAANPVLGEELFHYLVKQARQQVILVATGCFGADMQVQLVNDGPATFLLKV